MIFSYRTIILAISLVFSLNNICGAQTTMSGGIGLTLLNIASENSLELSNTFPHSIYLKESSYLTYPTSTLRLKINRQVAERFSASYHFILFIKKIDIDYYDAPSFAPILGYEGTSQIMSTTHSGSLNFQLTKNIEFGIGAFYQMIRPSYFTLLSTKNQIFIFQYPASQAGCLITTNFHVKRWSFQLNYLKAVGDIFFDDLADSIDSIELSALYQFHTFKTKKERRIRREQKGK